MHVSFIRSQENPLVSLQSTVFTVYLRSCTHLCNLCNKSVFSAEVINQFYNLGFFLIARTCSMLNNNWEFFFKFILFFSFFSGHTWYTWKWWSEWNEGDVFFSFSCGQLVSHLLLSRWSFTKLSELHAFYSL